MADAGAPEAPAPPQLFVLQQAVARKSVLMVLLVTFNFLALCQRCLATACQERTTPCNMAMCVIHLELKAPAGLWQIVLLLLGTFRACWVTDFLEVCQRTDLLLGKVQTASCVSGYLAAGVLLDKIRDKLIGLP